MDMFDLTAHRARVTPDRLALEDLADGTRYTYAALDERAARIAVAIRQRWGLEPGDRLAYLGHNRAEFFALLFACAKADVILVPLNWRLAVPELEGLMDDATPKALVFGAELADAAGALAANRSELVTIGLDHDQGRDYEADLAAVTPDRTPHPPRSPDGPWYLLYTSGTTGRPKGVIQTFRMMMANYWNIAIPVELRQSDVLLNVLPMFHTAGINLYSSAMFLVGGTVLVQRNFEPEQALEVLADRATVFFGVPAVYQMLADQPGFDGGRLSGVRSWGCGGAPLSLKVAQHFADHGIRVRTGFGMTETGPTVFLLDEASVLDKTGSVGRPQLLAEVRIIGRDGRDVAPGEAGELLVRGPGVTPGYWERPDATAETLEPDGWLHSGDVARCDDDGYYFIVDRWKDMFISGGENVYPAEVEQVLLQHPGVVDVAVVGMPDERWGEVGCAYACPAEGSQAPEEETLRAWCRERLAGYKVPKRFVLRDALPRNALGKVQKQELRDDARR